MQTHSSPTGLLKTPTPSSESRTDDFSFASRSGVQWTETGLWLLIVGVLLASEPYSNGTGTTLIIVGFIMVALGRKAFGQKHSRLALRAVMIFFLGLFAGIGNYVLALFLPFSNGSLNQYQIGGVIAVIVSGIALVMLTYTLQKSTGRILLWAGFIGSVAVNIFLFFYYGTGTSFPSVFVPFRINYLFADYILLSIIPAAPSATALYFGWRRINKGELPKQPEV
jgi:hypothetical protein